MNTKAPGSPTALRRSNLARVVSTLRGRGEMTQADVCRETGLSPATVSSIVRELTAEGRIEVLLEAGGRRSRRLRLSKEAGLAAGVAFGHTHVRVALADMAHQVVAEEVRALDVDASASEGLDVALKVLDDLLAVVGAARADVVGVGLGVPGPIDSNSGTLGSSAILPGWVGVQAAEVLQERVGRPVLVDNDANLGALAEVTWGAARGCRHVVYVKVASGLGAGLVLDGRLYRGARGTAGEIGHISIDEAGPVCRCGNRGCTETYVSAERLVADLPAAHGPLTVEGMLAMAEAGDAGARRVIADAGLVLGRAIAQLVNVFNPESVVVGGQLAQAGDVLLDPIRHAVSRSAIPSAAATVRIVPGDLGRRAEVLGALALVLTSSLVGDG